MFAKALGSLATSQRALEGVVSQVSQNSIPELMKHWNSSLELVTALQVTIEELQSGQLSTKDLYETLQTKLAEHSEVQTTLVANVHNLQADVEQLKEEKQAEADEKARLAELKARTDAFLRDAQAEERKINEAKAKAMEEAKDKAREKRFNAIEAQQQEAQKKQSEMAQQQQDILTRQQEMDNALKQQQQETGEAQESIIARLGALEGKERRRSNQARLQKEVDARRKQELENEHQLQSAVKLQAWGKRALLRVKCMRFIEASKSCKTATGEQDEAYKALKASVESGDVPNLAKMQEAVARVSSAVKAQERARAAVLGAKSGKARAPVATPLKKRDANAAMQMR